MRRREPVMVMGRAVGRRNDRIRQVLSRAPFGTRQPLVIDIGAGSLDRRELLPGARYLGTDIRPLPGLAFAADAGCMPLPDRSVDVVMGLELLEHVPDPFRVLQETRRLLRAGGIAVFSVPSTFPRHDMNDFWRFTKQGFEHLASNVFENFEVEVFGHTFESLAALTGYYVQLASHRPWCAPLEQLVPGLERAGHWADKRIPWARSDSGLHTLQADLLLIAWV